MKRSVLPNACMLFALVAVVCTSPAFGYNDPVDTAGPLEVRIDGPTEVTEIETALPVKVVLRNRGDAAVRGTVELGLVDAWRAEPAGAVPFEAPAGGETVAAFTVTAGAGTYSAHYPIHAYARFEHECKVLTAHPILVLETKLDLPPRPVRHVEWKPIRLPDAGRFALIGIPAHRSVVQVFNQPAKTMPTGWQGSEETCSGSTYFRGESLDGDSRETIAIHPPWRGGKVGTQCVEFPVSLPGTQPLKLTFANGMTPTGQSDGVTFRVRVVPIDAPEGQLGEIAFERHTASKAWVDGEADLSPYAGQTVRLQLESHPGPQNNTGWDQSYWAEPTLVVGVPQPPLPFPPGDEAESQLLGAVPLGDETCEVRVWPGRRGLLDAAVGFVHGQERLWFRGFRVRVLGTWIDRPDSPILLTKTSDEPCENGCAVRHSFESHAGTFDVVVRLFLDRGTLRAALTLENAPEPEPWLRVRLESTTAGPWSQPARQVYAGHGNVVRTPGPFRLGFDGHRLSTSFVGFDFDAMSLVQASDLPPDELEVRPDRRVYTLHVPHEVTFTFIPAGSVWKAVKVYRETNDLEAAGGVPEAAGRFVFDLWGGRYGSSEEALRKAFRYGLTDAMVIWHNWQRWGYDYRLPEIYPPNPHLGTLEEMQQLIATCKEAGVRIGVHDNYIDFYPDAEGFSYDKRIAFHSPDRPVKAWLNEGRDARSYRYRADQIEPFLKDNLARIRQHLAPDAFFIDVWSSARPYDYWTADGTFFDRVFTRDTWGELFAWIRDYLGGNAPQISESGHDQLIGWLDGAQTNHLRVGPVIPDAGRYGWTVWNWTCDDAERTCWFDAAHHDRFILHGAGYSSRYQGGLPRHLHGIYSDDYVATEVLTGHPAMVPSPFGLDVVRKYWLLHGVGRALAMRQIEDVEFVGGDLHRQHVSWSGGGQVWVNRGEDDWTVEGVVLPQYGFLARIPTGEGLVESSISRRNGLIVETARCPKEYYVNGRQMIDGPKPIHVRVDKVELRGSSLVVPMTWTLDVPIPEGYVPFLHWCDDEGEILFQSHLSIEALRVKPTGTIEATAGGHLPGQFKPGDEAELRVGFYNPTTGGGRLRLVDAGDGEARVRVGTLRIEGTDDQPTVAWTPIEPVHDTYLDRWNPKATPIDFGPLVTAGSCRLTRDGDALLLTPLPRKSGPAIPVAIRWDQLPWNLPGPAHVEAIADDGSLTRSAIVREDGRIVVNCEAGVFAYRLGR